MRICQVKVGSSGRVADLSVKTGRDRAGQHAYLAKTKANAVAGSDSETPPSQGFWQEF